MGYGTIADVSDFLVDNSTDNDSFMVTLGEHSSGTGAGGEL